jgi:hypothetical protein
LNSQSAIGQCHGLEFSLQAVKRIVAYKPPEGGTPNKNDIVFSMAVPGRSRCIEISRIYVAEAPHRA